jgi:hypothetical protein
MADVFVSYARADAAAARALAEHLEREGFSVWWDRKIPVGEAFDEELGEQLDAARCVVVLWSGESVKSAWVRNEAAEGLAKRALFPVMLETLRLPFGFRRLQTADLTGWTPPERHAGLDGLTAALKAALGGSARSRPLPKNAASTASAEQPGWFIHRWRRSIFFRVVVMALPVVVMGVGAVAMSQMRVPTPVHLELQVRKVEFTVGGSDLTPVLESIGFSSLRVEHFDAVTFSPKIVRVVSAQNPDARLGPGTWNRIGPGEVTLTARDSESTVWIEPLPEDKAPLGTLDRLYLQPGSVVTLERRLRKRGVELGVRLDQLRQPLAPAANASGRPFRMFAGHVDSSELRLPGVADEWLLEVENKESSPAIGIRGSADRLDLWVGVAAAAVLDLLPKAGTPITQVTLISQDADRNWESTLTADGKLSYPDHPDIAPLDISRSDLIGLSELSDFSITQLQLNPGGESMNLHLVGIAGHINTRAGEIARDRRLTVLEIYRSNAALVFWVTLIGGAVTALYSAVTALKEMRA